MDLKPCPFCGSHSIDPEGWVSTERKGPACDDCGASADTVEIWNTRPQVHALQEAITAFSKAVSETNGPSLAVQRHDPSWAAWKHLCDVSAAYG